MKGQQPCHALQLIQKICHPFFLPQILWGSFEVLLWHPCSPRTTPTHCLHMHFDTTGLWAAEICCLAQRRPQQKRRHNPNNHKVFFIAHVSIWNSTCRKKLDREIFVKNLFLELYDLGGMNMCKKATRQHKHEEWHVLILFWDREILRNIPLPDFWIFSWAPHLQNETKQYTVRYILMNKWDLSRYPLCISTTTVFGFVPSYSWTWQTFTVHQPGETLKNSQWNPWLNKKNQIGKLKTLLCHQLIFLANDGWTSLLMAINYCWTSLLSNLSAT